MCVVFFKSTMTNVEMMEFLEVSNKFNMQRNVSKNKFL